VQAGERIRRDGRFEYCDVTLAAAGVSERSGTSVTK
jgi:hypothetical protein